MPSPTPVPPLTHHSLLVFLLAVSVLLLMARTLGRLAERFGMPAIVGELLTGMILGPSLLGSLAPELVDRILPAEPAQMHLIDAVGQIGLLLLVGVTGAHLDLAMLRRRGTTAARISLCGLIIPLSLGLALGAVLPASLMGSGGETNRGIFALFMAVAMCVAAIPVIAKTFSDMGMLHRNVGQLTLAPAMVDDTVGWFLLSVVSAAATVGVGVGLVTLSVLYLAGFVIFAVLVGRPVVRWVMRTVDRSPEPGPTVATAVIIVLLGAAVTHALKMEPVFGAFVAGILIGAPNSANQAKLAPLRTVVLSVLAPIFLATAGLRMDLTALADPTVALAAVAVLALAILGKFTGAYLGARLSRLTHWESLAIGSAMNARGVVEVIVALTGLRLGVLNTETYTIIVLVAIATSLMAPPMLRFTMGRITQNDEERLRKLEYDSWYGVAAANTDPPNRNGG